MQGKDKFAYYVTYLYQNANGTVGFGCFRYGVSKKIKTYEDITTLNSFIEKNYTSGQKSMVQDWKLLDETFHSDEL